MATKSQEILLKGNTTNASAIPSSLKVREIAINALDRSLFTNDGNSIVKLYTGTTKWFDVNGNANNALKLGGILASEYINKEAFNSHINNSTIHITAAERTKWNNKWDYNEETIKGVKVNAAVSADKATKLATARKIWGKYFDGLSDVSGDLIDVGNITASGKATIQGDIVCGGEVVAVAGEGTPAGVTDYSALTGKPQINGVTLVSGNNTLVSLGIQPAGDYATNSGVTTLLADYAKKTFVANNYAGKAAFNSHIADTDIHITASERIAWNAKWDYDEATIKAVKVTSASSADSIAWSGITGKPTTFTPSAHTHTASDVSGLPTSLKNPYALTFGSKSYDGSAAATITASDLGALTAHQSIYAFTLQVNGTSKGVYNPASAAKTINIVVPTKTSDITNDSGFITNASIPTSLKNPYAVEIKANGVSLGTYDGSAVATFNLSAANVGAANKVHSHTASEISGLPTKLSAFTNDVGFITGITKSMVEGVLTGNITSHTHSYLPLTGGILTSSDVVVLGLDTTNDIQNAFLLYHKGVAKTQLGYVVSKGSYIYDYSTRIHLGIDVNGAAYCGTSVDVSNNNHHLLIHSGNYNSYAPTLTGTGASGTWGINISGNAASADVVSKTYANQSINFACTESKIRLICITAGDASGNGFPSQYVGGISAISNYVGWQMVSFGSSVVPNPYFRMVYDTGDYSDWKQLAFLTDNVASATKLQTPRTIWGQSFDGSTDVNGDFTMQKNAYGGSGNLVYYALNFWGSVEGRGGMFRCAINDTYGRFSHFEFGDEENPAYMSILRYGNVLIGTTTNNGYKLDVNGTGHYSGDLIVDGEVSALVA